MEEDPEFTEDFKRVFNNSDITEADDFTLEVLKKKTCGYGVITSERLIRS